MLQHFHPLHMFHLHRPNKKLGHWALESCKGNNSSRRSVDPAVSLGLRTRTYFIKKDWTKSGVSNVVNKHMFSSLFLLLLDGVFICILSFVWRKWRHSVLKRGHPRSLNQSNWWIPLKPTRMIDALTALETKVPATSCINIFDWWCTLPGLQSVPTAQCGEWKGRTLVLTDHA